MLGLITSRDSKKFYSSYKKLLSLPKSRIQVLERGFHEGIAITLKETYKFPFSNLPSLFDLLLNSLNSENNNKSVVVFTINLYTENFHYSIFPI